MIHELDPRLYGIAPKEADVHNGQVLWTMEAVMRYMGISEQTLRLNPDLMRLRRTISPRVHRWIPDEVRAYVANLPTGPTPLAVVKALTTSRQAVRQKRKARMARKGWEKELDAKIGWEAPELPKSRRRKKA